MKINIGNGFTNKLGFKYQFQHHNHLVGPDQEQGAEKEGSKKDCHIYRIQKDIHILHREPTMTMSFTSLSVLTIHDIFVKIAQFKTK